MADISVHYDDRQLWLATLRDYDIEFDIGVISGYYMLLTGLCVALVMNVHITLPYWIYMLCKRPKVDSQ